MNDVTACALNTTTPFLPTKISLALDSSKSLHRISAAQAKITNLHGHTGRPELSEVPHQVASITLEISGTVSPVFGIASDEEVPPVGTHYLQPILKLKGQVPFRLTSDDRTLLVGWAVPRRGNCRRQTHYDCQQDGWKCQPSISHLLIPSRYPVLALSRTCKW